MHNEDIERPISGDDARGDDGHDDVHDAVIAADDTGLISQQEILTESELGEGLPDDAEAGGP